MDSAEPTQNELDAELKELRAGMRAYAKKLALHVQQMGMPETPLAAERTARMVRAADQMLIQVYAPPPPPPRPRSVPATNRPRMDDELDDDAPEDDEDAADDRQEWANRVMKMIRISTRAHAQATGFWPDGQAYDADDDDWQAAAESELQLTRDLADANGDLSTDGFFALLLRRFNAQTRFQAEKRGVWPDDRPYRPGDPGFGAVTANAQVMTPPRPAKGEIPGPGYLPGWVIRRPP